jgi:hypothetical protein
MAKENQESIDKIKAEKLQALERTLGNIEKHFGKGTIMKLGDAPVENIPSISTGSIGLDAALGIGGLPKGRVVEIYGPESSGKTTLAIHAVAEAQKLGGIAAFIDAEHAFDRFYAQKLGVDIQNLLVSQPDNGEQALEIYFSGMCFTNCFSVSKGVFELVVSPILAETLKTCVSTAIAGLPKATEAITFAVLRPTPGSFCNSSNSTGTTPPKSLISF